MKKLAAEVLDMCEVEPLRQEEEGSSRRAHLSHLPLSSGRTAAAAHAESPAVEQGRPSGGLTWLVYHHLSIFGLPASIGFLVAADSGVCAPSPCCPTSASMLPVSLPLNILIL